MKIVRVSNSEYSFLFNLGGDSLIAVFATLRAYKPGAIYVIEGKAGPLALLRSKTGLSRSVIDEYTPTLIATGLVDIHPNGNVAVRGRNWTRKNLPHFPNYKLIPIQIGPKFTDTKLYVAFVRVHANIRKQKSRIGRKAEQIELLRERQNGTIKTHADYKRSEWLLRKGGLKVLLSSYLSISSISNLGFYKLLKNKDGKTDAHKRIGHHFKKKLLQRGLINQSRHVQRVSTLRSKVGLEVLSSSSSSGGFFIGSKGIYYEGTPRIEVAISPLVGNKKKQVEK